MFQLPQCKFHALIVVLQYYWGPMFFTMLFLVVSSYSLFCFLFYCLRSHEQSRSFSPPNLSFLLVSLFSHLHLILYVRVPKFFCSVILLTVPSWVLLAHRSVAVCYSAAPLSTFAFLGISAIRSPTSIGGICPSSYLVVFQISSWSPAIPLPSFIVQQTVYTALPWESLLLTL
jgi:hypothetical protein